MSDSPPGASSQCCPLVETRPPTEEDSSAAAYSTGEVRPPRVTRPLPGEMFPASRSTPSQPVHSTSHPSPPPALPIHLPSEWKHRPSQQMASSLSTHPDSQHTPESGQSMRSSPPPCSSWQVPSSSQPIHPCSQQVHPSSEPKLHPKSMSSPPPLLPLYSIVSNPPPPPEPPCPIVLNPPPPSAMLSAPTVFRPSSTTMDTRPEPLCLRPQPMRPSPSSVCRPPSPLLHCRPQVLNPPPRLAKVSAPEVFRSFSTLCSGHQRPNSWLLHPHLRRNSPHPRGNPHPRPTHPRPKAMIPHLLPMRPRSQATRPNLPLRHLQLVHMRPRPQATRPRYVNEIPRYVGGLPGFLRRLLLESDFWPSSPSRTHPPEVVRQWAGDARFCCIYGPGRPSMVVDLAEINLMIPIEEELLLRGSGGDGGRRAEMINPFKELERRAFHARFCIPTWKRYRYRLMKEMRRKF